MSAVDSPTIDELRRGAIAAAVKDGRITPQEAEAQLRAIRAGAPRPDRSASRPQVPR